MDDLFDTSKPEFEPEPHWLAPIDLPDGVRCGSLFKLPGMRFFSNRTLIGIAKSRVFWHDEPEIARQILKRRGVKIF